MKPLIISYEIKLNYCNRLTSREFTTLYFHSYKMYIYINVYIFNYVNTHSERIEWINVIVK